MARAWVEFWPNATAGLVGFHRSWTDNVRELPPSDWIPPVKPVPGKGYPRIHVEFDGSDLWFVSTLEMQYVATVLDTRLVDPATSQEWWYRHLPASIKGKHARGRVAKLLREAIAAYEQLVPRIVAAPTPVPRERGEYAVAIVDLPI